jgi:hypothetical protein
MRGAGRAVVGVVAVALSAVPRAGSADDGPIVVRGDGRGVVESRVDAPGLPGATRAGPAGPAAAAIVTCRYFKQYYSVSVPGGRMVDLGGPTRTARGSGQWWLKVCSDGSRDVVFVPDGVDPNGTPVVAPATLAMQAYNWLRLPRPVPVFNPARPTSVGPATTAHLPTWWWVRDWRTLRQRTAAGPVWVVVTARPVRSVWDPGDGGPEVACAGPGRAWAVGSAASSAVCSSTYEASSAGQAGRVYRAAVTTVWAVSWVGAGGAAGSLPALRLTTVFPVAVMERESVVVEAGGGR